MTYKCLILICLISTFSLARKAHAIDDFLVNIGQVSSSGKTIYVDSGFSNEINDNDYGVLVIKKQGNADQFFFKPVAKVRVIKVFSDHSIWIVYKAFLPEHIKRGKKLFLFSETAFLRGRKQDHSFKRTKLVTKTGKSKEVKDFLLEGDELAKKNKDYQIISKTHEKETHLGKDFDLIDIDRWEKDSSSEKLFAHGIYRSPYAKEFSKRKRVHTFEKMMVAFLNKYNDPNFDYDLFYEEQKRSEGGDDNFQDQNLYANYLKNYEKTVQYKAAKEEKFLQKVRENGDAWSADYSDEELSEVLNKLSIAKERQRRKKLLAFKYNYQLYAAVNANLLNNENTNDPRNTEQNKYDLDFAWEGYLFKKLQALKSFTLEGSFRRSQDGFYSGDANIKSVEYSAAVHINWYPYRHPNMIETNIPYLGILFRFGVSTLSIPSESERGNYQVIGFPGVKGGIKYNFRNSYGVRLSASFERLRAEKLIKTSATGLLPNRAHYLDGKVGIGLSKFF